MNILSAARNAYKNTQARLINTLASHCAQPLQTQNIRRALIIAPHPDDEALACAGLIQRLHTQHATVHILMLTAGEAAYLPHEIPARELIAKRRELMHNAGLPYSGCQHPAVIYTATQPHEIYIKNTRIQPK
jgi:hypothetical protein